MFFWDNTVDGRNLAITSWYGKYPMIYRVLAPSCWLFGISEPSTVTPTKKTIKKNWCIRQAALPRWTKLATFAAHPENCCQFFPAQSVQKSWNPRLPGECGFDHYFFRGHVGFQVSNRFHDSQYAQYRLTKLSLCQQSRIHEKDHWMSKWKAGRTKIMI